MHDFAWTADPNYVEAIARFSATGDVTPAEYAQTAALLGRTLDEVRLSDVEIRVLMQPGRRPQIAALHHGGEARAQVLRALVRPLSVQAP